MRYPKISDDPKIQKDYREMRKAGSSHKLAEMLALQSAPGASGVDNTFMSGTENGKQFAKSPWLGAAYKKISERLAPGSTSGAKYISQIARFGGDPKAWVRSRADVKKRVHELGDRDIDGMVTVRGAVRDPKPPVPIAEDIVQSMVRAKVARDPSLNTPKKLKHVRREILEKHTIPSRRKYIKD